MQSGGWFYPMHVLKWLSPTGATTGGVLGAVAGREVFNYSILQSIAGVLEHCTLREPFL